MKKLLYILFITLTILLVPANGNFVFANQKELQDFFTSQYSNFNLISQTEFYCVNSSTNQIEQYNNGETTSFGTYGEESGQFTEVQKLLVLKNGEIVVFDSLNKLHFFDSSFQFTKTIKTISQDGALKPIGHVSDIISDIYSNVYLLDTTNGFVLKTNSSSTNFEIVKNITLSSSAKLTIINNSNNFVLLNNKTLKTTSTETELETTPQSLFSDSKGFIYLVYSNKIEKYTQNLTLVDSSDAEIGNYYSVNLENGTIIYLSNNKIQTLENFVSNSEDYTPPTNINNKTPSSQSLKLFSPTKSVNLLKNPYSSTSVAELSVQDKVILLGKTEDFETNFCYVMFTKNKQTVVGYVEEHLLSAVTIPTSNASLIPVRNDVPYFKYPNDSEEFKISTLNPSFSFKLNAEVEIDGTNYYELALDSNFIYAKADDLIDAENTSINTYIITNAKIAPYKNENIVLYASPEKTTQLLCINTETNVKLTNNLQNGLSEIELLIDGKIVKGYIETRFVIPQNDFSLPLTIILSLVCLITLIILILKLKQDKSKNKINN
ncbi:MAG: hypothetical protein ACI4TI_02635 [Christensenellales bacterium]